VTLGVLRFNEVLDPDSISGPEVRRKLSLSSEQLGGSLPRIAAWTTMSTNSHFVETNVPGPWLMCGHQVSQEEIESPQEALKDSSKIFLRAAYGPAKQSFL
jgi:hypothetical protein